MTEPNDRSPAPGEAASSLPGRLLGPYLALLFRWALGVIFIVASWDKILHPLAFAQSISHYRIVPLALINGMAICLPWIELCCGLLLLLGVGIRANLIVVTALLLVFIAAILSAMRRKLDISWGCFSVEAAAHPMTRWTLYWDIVWTAMSLHTLIFDRALLSLPSLLRRTRGCKK
jgi:putative oxidoreductase